jgi:hypothetical protein
LQRRATRGTCGCVGGRAPLSIKVGGYDFEGPFLSTERLQSLPGVYAIVTPEEGRFAVLDVGEASNLRASLEGDARERCWREKSDGAYMFSALYTRETQRAGRMEIVTSLRKLYGPPCSER